MRYGSFIQREKLNKKRYIYREEERKKNSRASVAPKIYIERCKRKVCFVIARGIWSALSQRISDEWVKMFFSSHLYQHITIEKSFSFVFINCVLKANASDHSYRIYIFINWINIFLPSLFIISWVRKKYNLHLIIGKTRVPAKVFFQMN